MGEFKYRQFEGEIIIQCVRWYCKYGISYRELEEMMLERGIEVDHTTIYRWVQRYAPAIEKKMRWYLQGGTTGSWRVDETYIKVKGKWKYLYRAVDSKGRTIDFYLSHTRNAKAAHRFLSKCLSRIPIWAHPSTLNTDQNPTYPIAIAKLKEEKKLNEDVVHRKEGFETFRMFRKHQFDKWCQFPENLKDRLKGEIRLIERQFNLYSSLNF